MPELAGKKGGVLESLNALKDGWGDTEQPPSYEVPDGRYNVSIESAILNKSKKSGRLQVSWSLKILDGEYRGRMLFKHDGIDNDTGRSFFRGALARLGVDWPDSPSEIPQILEGLNGSQAQVNCKTKDDAQIQNVYFVRHIPTEDQVEDESGDDVAEVVELSVGQRVSADYDGETATGTIAKVNAKKQTATVNWDDETEDTLSWSELTILEEEDPPARNAKPTKGGKSNGMASGRVEKDEPGCEVTFEDDDLSGKDSKAIKQLAADLEVEPENYDNNVAMLLDIAENAGVTGKFTQATKLIDAIREAVA